MPAPTWNAAPILTIIRGDDQTLEFYVIDSAEEAMDLSEYTIRFSGESIANPTLRVELDLDSGIALDDDDPSLVIVTLGGSLDILQTIGRYRCDLEVTAPASLGSIVTTVALFYLNVIDDVSK